MSIMPKQGEGTKQKKSHNMNLHLKTILYFFGAIFIGRRAIATHFELNAVKIVGQNLLKIIYQLK